MFLQMKYRGRQKPNCVFLYLASLYMILDRHGHKLDWLAEVYIHKAVNSSYNFIEQLELAVSLIDCKINFSMF